MIKNERKFIVSEHLECFDRMFSFGVFRATGCSATCIAVVGIQFMDLYDFEVFENSVWFKIPAYADRLPGGEWQIRSARSNASKLRFKLLGDRQIEQ